MHWSVCPGDLPAAFLLQPRPSAHTTLVKSLCLESSPAGCTPRSAGAAGHDPQAGLSHCCHRRLRIPAFPLEKIKNALGVIPPLCDNDLEGGRQQNVFPSLVFFNPKHKSCWLYKSPFLKRCFFLSCPSSSSLSCWMDLCHQLSPPHLLEVMLLQLPGLSGAILGYFGLFGAILGLFSGAYCHSYPMWEAGNLFSTPSPHHCTFGLVSDVFLLFVFHPLRVPQVLRAPLVIQDPVESR